MKVSNGYASGIAARLHIPCVRSPLKNNMFFSPFASRCRRGDGPAPWWRFGVATDVTHDGGAQVTHRVTSRKAGHGLRPRLSDR
jgi:hypothetical protein